MYNVMYVCTCIGIEYSYVMCLHVAAETWTFGRLLPIMIGHHIPHDDSHWMHFLQLLDIVDIVFAPILHKDYPASLLVLIEDNLHRFVRLYPTANVIPKMHHLLHLPRYIEK